MTKAQKTKRVFAVVYLAAALMLMLYFGEQFLFFGLFGLRKVMICFLSIGIPAVLGMTLWVGSLDTPEGKLRAVRIGLWFAFGFCLVGLTGTLFLCRLDLSVFVAGELSGEFGYAPEVNFVPLRTILLYIRALEKGIIPGTSYRNLLGNLAIMMPMGALLPLLFPKLRRFGRFLMVMTILLASVEGLQYVLNCGSCDIDDVLLNLIGATGVYFILRIPPVRGILVRLYLMPAQEAELSPAGAIQAPDGNRLDGVGIKACVAVAAALLLGFLLKRESAPMVISMVAVSCLLLRDEATVKACMKRFYAVGLGTALGAVSSAAGVLLPVYGQGLYILLVPSLLLGYYALASALGLKEQRIGGTVAFLSAALRIPVGSAPELRYVLTRCLDAVIGGAVAFLAAVSLPPYPVQDSGQQKPRR